MVRRVRLDERRLAAVPVRRLLVGVRQCEHGAFAELGPDDLQADRQAGAREPARHADRGNAEDVERQRVADQRALGGRVRHDGSNRRRRRHARRRDEDVDIREAVGDRVACDRHTPALLDVDLRRDALTTHDAPQSQRLIQRALRRVGEQRRVIRVGLRVEQRVRLGRRDRHVARPPREADEHFDGTTNRRVDLGIELSEERRARNADPQVAHLAADRGV